MTQPPVPGARLVVPRAAIDGAYARLCQQVQVFVDQGDCILLGIMLGGLIPLARLVAGLGGDFEFDTCRISRYGHARTGGELRWVARPTCRLQGRHVIVIDDIFDEGVTLRAVIDACRSAGAARTTSLALVRKRHGRAGDRAQPDLVGLEAGDEFLFGAGMDHHGKWRHLPDIWGLRPDS